MSTLSERTLGLAARMPDRPRELQEVELVLIDGTEIRGLLHRTHGTRTLDFLNRQSEGFLAMTQAVLTRGAESQSVSFVAVNKAHVIRVIEAADAD